MANRQTMSLDHILNRDMIKTLWKVFRSTKRAIHVVYTMR